MRRPAFLPAPFTRCLSAQPGRVRRSREALAPAPNRVWRLSAVLVAAAVLASALVFASTAAAHNIDPVYSCEQGEPGANNLCTATADATAEYSCDGEAKLSGTQCLTDTGTVPTVSCPTGTPAGDECVHTANPTYTCSVGKPSGNQCVHTTAAADPCPTGQHAGNQCVHTADPTYTCASGTLSGNRCLHTASPTYRCASGTLRGAKCVTTHAPVCTLNNDFVDCNTPGVTYHCSTGFSVSAGQCIRTTAATPSCPAGYQSGAFGICYRYTAARSSCPAGYDPPSQGICYKRTPAANPCQNGYTHANGQCTRTTTARSNCPSGYDPPSQGICYKRTPADIACATGIPRGGKCVTAAPATLTHTCPGGVAPNDANQCVTNPPAAITCDGKKTTDATCAHTHTPPTISDLAPSGTSTAGQTYSDPFTVTPATAAVEASGAGCGLSGSSGSYTLTATSAHTTPQTVSITCTVTATADNLTATATATVSFNPAEHTIRPTRPRNLRCTAATETTATWTWRAADRAHSYWYRYSSRDAWAQAGDANTRTHTRTGITPTTRNGGWGNIRYFTLIARNNIGDSSHKNAVCVTLPPNWLTAECSATGEITANWSKPLGLNNTAPVNYTATAVTEPPSVLGTDTLTPYNGQATTSTHTGEPGTTYTIRVQTQPIANKPIYSETTTIECEAPCPHEHDGFGCHGVEIMHECRNGEHRDPNLVGPLTGYQGCHPVGDTHSCPDGKHFHNESDHHLSSCHTDHDVRSHPVPEMVIGVHSAELERSLRSRLNSRVQFLRPKEADTAAIFEASLFKSDRAMSGSSIGSVAGDGGGCLEGQHSHILVSGCHNADTEHPDAPWTITSGNGVVPPGHLVELLQEPTPTPPAPDGLDSSTSTPSGQTARASRSIDRTGALWLTVTLDFNLEEIQCMRWYEWSIPGWASDTDVLNIFWETRPRSGSVMTTPGHEYRFAEKPGPGESWTGYTPCYMPVNKHGKGVIRTTPPLPGSSKLRGWPAEYSAVGELREGRWIPPCNHDDLEQRITMLWETEQEQAWKHPYRAYALSKGLPDVPWHGSPVRLVAVPNYHLYECVDLTLP